MILLLASVAVLILAVLFFIAAVVRLRRASRHAAGEEWATGVDSWQ